MLIKKETLDGIAEGRISLAFRRWHRPTVKAGGRLRTAIGELAILAVDAVEEGDIDDSAALRAGYPSRGTLLQALSSGREGTLYRIEVRLAGPDPRAVLRERATFSADELADVSRRLERFDSVCATGAWTLRVLRLIAEHPGVLAGVIAKRSGIERTRLKRDVRKLKELGLTESLAIGYRLSPRGKAFLERADASPSG